MAEAPIVVVEAQNTAVEAQNEVVATLDLPKMEDDVSFYARGNSRVKFPPSQFALVGRP